MNTETNVAAANTPEAIPLEIQMKLAEVQEAILSAHPQLPVLLQQIHKQLKADPAVVTLMSEEQIAFVVEGLQKITGVKLAESILKAGKGKALKNIGVMDL